MFAARKPSEVAAQIKIEYSPNSPAMRLTLVNYILTQGGELSDLPVLLEFVGENYDAFCEELAEAFVDPDEQADTARIDGMDDPFGVGGYA